MSMLSVLVSILSIACLVLGFPERDIPNVEPEYLDMLLDTNQHELFSKLMGIENVNLVRPYEGERTERPIFHKELRMGDILPRIPKADDEESRQTLKTDIYTGNKWNNGYVPYAISSKYSRSQRKVINNAIDRWNRNVTCIKMKPRTNEKDYIWIFSGSGCYSNLGKVGGQQGLSLDVKGCVYQGTLLHEVEHAVGISHEQNRSDRDDYITMNWGNITPDWQSQYEKNNEDHFRNSGPYDYYSIMHYGVLAPETNKPAFDVIQQGIDINRIGNGDDLTKTDIEKIHSMYCN